MVNTILRLPEVVKRTGLSRSTIYLKIDQGHFPRQIKLSERAMGWPSSVIDDWIQDRIDESQGVAS